MKYLRVNIISLFFFLMLVIPTVLQAERGILLSIILSGTLIYSIRDHNSFIISRKILLILLAIVLYSTLSILYGVVLGAPGAIEVSTVYVIWPVIFVYLSGFVASISLLYLLVKVLMVGIFIASLSCVLLISSKFFPVLNVLGPYFDLMGGSLGFYDGTIEFNLFNMPTSIYGLAFFIAFFLIRDTTKKYFSYKWLNFCFLGLILCLFVMLVSGRRSFIVVGFLSIPITLFIMKAVGNKQVDFYRILKTISFVFIFLIITYLVTAATLGLDITLLAIDFTSGFDFDDNSNISAYRRKEQFDSLIGEWLDSPWIGYGHGSFAKGAPGDVMPWAYELQYIALLFQVGIIGLLIYGLPVIWLIFEMIYLSRKYQDLAVLMVPTLVGLICFLVANATNPYISKFDYLWTLFLPVAMVNYGLTRHNKLNF